VDRTRWSLDDPEGSGEGTEVRTLRSVQAALAPEFGEKWIEEHR
jgi:hypothetical protein